MFRWTVPLQVFFERFSARSIRVPSIEHIYDNIRTVNDFVKLFPNSLRQTLLKNSVSSLFTFLETIVFVEIGVLGWLIETLLLLNLSNKIIHARQG